MAEVASFLSKSDVMWVAFTVLLTYGSVHLTNRHAGNQQRRAMVHEAEQRDKERKMSLRRDVYLPAADSILKAQNLTIRLLDPATPVQEIALQLPNELYVISRTLVVGSDKTIQSVLMILDAIEDTFVTLVFKRETLTNSDEYINSIEYVINQCEKIDQLIPPALVAIREELELPFDQEAFSKNYMNNTKKRKDRLQVKLDAIKRD